MNINISLQHIHGWFSSFRIPNVNNGHDHVTFVEKCVILSLVITLHDERVDIYV